MDTSRAPVGAPLEGCVSPCVFTLLQEGILRVPPSHGHRQQICKLDDHYSSSVGVSAAWSQGRSPTAWPGQWYDTRLTMTPTAGPVAAHPSLQHSQEAAGARPAPGWVDNGRWHQPQTHLTPSLPSFPPSQRSFVQVPPLSESFCHATSVLGETYVTTCFG